MGYYLGKYICQGSHKFAFVLENRFSESERPLLSFRLSADCQGGWWVVGGVQWVVVFQPRFLDTLPLPERYFSFACCVQLIPLPKWIATESLAHTRQDVVFGGRNPKGHAKTTSAIWRKRVVPCGRRDMNIDHPLSQRTFCKPTHLDLVYWFRVPWNTPIDCSLMSPVN